MEHLLLSFASVMQSIGYVVLAIVVLLIMITVHEFGHYVAGKAFGFGIEEFAIGFGPKLYSRTRKSGEIFSVRALPIGGFCAFKGEDEDDEDPKAFNNRKPWQRIIVLVAGALMNYLLALLLIFVLFGAYGRPAYAVIEREPPAFQSAAEDGVLDNYLKEGDVILTMNGRRVYMATDLMRAVDKKKGGDLLPVTVIRNGETVELEVKLRRSTSFTNIEDTDALLTALGLRSLGATNVRVGFFASIGNGFEYSFRIAGTIFTVLGQVGAEFSRRHHHHGFRHGGRNTHGRLQLPFDDVLFYRRESGGVQSFADPRARRQPRGIHGHRMDKKETDQPQSRGCHSFRRFRVFDRLCRSGGYIAVVLIKKHGFEPCFRFKVFRFAARRWRRSPAIFR